MVAAMARSVRTEYSHRSHDLLIFFIVHSFVLYLHIDLSVHSVMVIILL